MITENLKYLEDTIQKKCIEINRNREDITVIAVSKNNPFNAIIEANNYGCFDFGENKAQELRDKAELLIEKNINWHFIGHLQTNKVKYVIKHAKFIHSVESFDLADEIDKRANIINKIQSVFIECNISNEESKFGLQDKEKIFSLANYIKSKPNLSLRGLMTMAPYTDDEIVIRSTFRGLKKVYDELNFSGFALTELSMGMTNDFLIALEEGATMLRIGTAIFGDRI
ncbi:MAG TPA: YggS family pyridoxal phosphate-dependent enzyme [Melioribacteraceae bacterium]|nr:YggS family pyridoxal phosphate-dependent enzyme [Melioribacteraceae bacterium]